MDSAVVGMVQGIARRNAEAAESWEAYAWQLERKLATANAGLSAMRTLKDVAIAELGKVDPNNYLLSRANRQRILDEAYTKA